MPPSLLPGRYDHHIYAGDTYIREFALIDVDVDGLESPSDVSGGAWDAEIRTKPGGAVLATFAILVGVDGLLTLSLTSAETTEFGGDITRQLSWDLQRTYADSTIRTLAEGLVVVIPEVTRVSA